MGKAKDSNKARNIFTSNSVSSTPTTELNPSRLTETTEDLRNSLVTRNLYTDFRQYPLQPNDRQRIVNSVSTVLDTVAPFNSNSLSNSLLGRIASTPTTPLTDIGLIMLTKQFTLNFKSNVAQEVFPTIKLSNLWDGSPDSKLFTENKNFRITQREDAGNLDNFLERFFGNYRTLEYPFVVDNSNEEYLRNTGSAQLTNLFDAINKNLYKTNDSTYSELATEIKVPILDRVNDIPYYSYLNDNKFNPYLYVGQFLSQEAIDDANITMELAYENVSKNTNAGQEYVPNLDAVDDLGKTKKDDDFDIEINEETGFNEDIDNQIVWGRDGITERTNNRIDILRGLEDDAIAANNNLADKFNVRIGLLEYTRNLLNASQGKFVDQTRKRFTQFNPVKTGFNGSGLWEAPEDSLFEGRVGVRQHSILDQYDRFAKAIRFDGNEVYGGNPDSVIYKSVIPRIHPTLNKENQPDPKNLMFSIENLAIRVIDNSELNYAIIDDEFGTQIPKCEAGPFGGRIMWFPPYIESFNEVAAAKYDPTVMVGRNEPIYTYMHSERSATLSFKVLMDHPEQVKSFTNHKEVAEFFAFGGGDTFKSEVKNEAKKLSNNDDKIKEIQGPIDELPPNIQLPADIGVYYPNDFPNGSSFSVIDDLYNVQNYEIIQGLKNTEDVESFGLNQDIFLLTGLTKINESEYELNVPPGFTQSQAKYIEGERRLDDSIYQVFNDENNVKFFKITIVGESTKLYTPGVSNPTDDENAEQYNDELGLRRAEAAKSFIEERIKKVIGKSPDSLGITIEATTIGATSASDQNASVESIPSRSAKSERAAVIKFEKNTVTPDPKETNLTSEDQESINRLKEENQVLQSRRNIDRRNGTINCVMNERDIEDGILKGSKAITQNKFYSAYHSQTPEDFHKRLTFLQQCTRQGAAIRANPEVDPNGITRVKNSVFGRQPISILRVGDFYYTKVIIENVTIDYDENIWDTNPEGWGLQPMIANVTLQMKVLGGQSLKGPIDALQNAVSFNYYANSTFKNEGVYRTATAAAESQESYNEGVLTQKQVESQDQFNQTITYGIPNNIYGYTDDDVL